MKDLCSRDATASHVSLDLQIKATQASDYGGAGAACKLALLHEIENAHCFFYLRGKHVLPRFCLRRDYR